MITGPKLTKSRKRWIMAITSSTVFILFAFLLIKKSYDVPKLLHVQNTPLIHLINENENSNNRNYEAFFLPTKYNFSLKIKKQTKTPIYQTKIESGKPIFSNLDRLRIFRTFTDRFIESEYWTVTHLQMHPKVKIFTANKTFIDNPIQQQHDIIFEKVYNISSQFLFLEHGTNEYSK